MSPDHSLDHDRILERVFEGELEPGAAEVQALAADCPSCAARLDELRELVQLLDDAGRERREILRQAPDPEPDPLVRGTVAGLLAGESPCLPPHARGATPRWLGNLLLGLAAAAAYLFWAVQAGLFDGSDRLPRGPEQLLGDGQHVEQLLQPRGAGADFTHFSWRGSLPAHGWYVVRVWNLDAPGGAQPEPLVSPPLQSPSWYPGPERLAELSERIRWSATAHDAAGVELGSREAEASR